MKKLILWLLMVVLFVAVLLGGTVGAIYYMTDEGDMPAETATFGGVALEMSATSGMCPSLAALSTKIITSLRR